MSNNKMWKTFFGHEKTPKEINPMGCVVRVNETNNFL
jgi:hypothetical protein